MEAEVSVGTRCEACGYVEIPIRAVALVLVAWQEELSFYTFACTGCGQHVMRGAPDAVLRRVIISAGVTCRRVERPRELDELHADLALTADDLIVFHLELQDEDYLAPIAREGFP